MTSSHTSNSADISSQRRLWREGLTRTTLSGLERSSAWLRVGLGWVVLCCVALRCIALCCVAVSFFLSECLEYSCNRLTMRIDGSIYYVFFVYVYVPLRLLINLSFSLFLFLSLCSVVLYARDFHAYTFTYMYIRDSNNADIRS